MLPVNLASACAFSPSLVEESFAVCGQQMRDMGVDLALVSVMDILRDPRWGRSEECFGDDPFLSSRMAEAVLRGIQRGGVDTVAKHYCAQVEMTGGVNSSAARIGMRELREIHLPADRSGKIHAGQRAFPHGNHAVVSFQQYIRLQPRIKKITGQTPNEYVRRRFPGGKTGE